MARVGDNLFACAPHELSHSAYWAWILKSLDASAPPHQACVRPLARRLVEKIGAPPLVSPVEVETERTLGKGIGRVDIFVEDGRGYRLLIENKVKAGLRHHQLGYRQAIENEGTLAVLTTAFDSELLSALEVPVLDLDDLIDVTAGSERLHPVLEHHMAWLRTLQAERREEARTVLSATGRELQTVLESAHAQ